MITTRNPISQFAQTLDRTGALSRALDQVLTDSSRAGASVWMPALEVAERGDAYLIAIDLPGVQPDQVELHFENNVLTLRGARTPGFVPSPEGGAVRVHISERHTGGFERSVRLPEYVEGDRIAAEFTDGVLVVTVPKSSAAQPRRIPIAGATRAATSDGGDPVREVRDPSAP